MAGRAVDTRGQHDRAGHQVTLAARRRGAIVRPLGDVVVLMPPLAITERELRRLLAIVSVVAATIAVLYHFVP